MIAITSFRFVVVFGTTIGGWLAVVVVVVVVVVVGASEIQIWSPIMIFVEVLAPFKVKTFFSETSKRAAMRVHESLALAV